MAWGFSAKRSVPFRRAGGAGALRVGDGEPDRLGVRVAVLQGGDRHNVIPREASALVTVPIPQATEFPTAVQDYQALERAELAISEPAVTISATPVALPATVMAAKAQSSVIRALYGSLDGVVRMSDSVPGLVETSTNMGLLKIARGQVEAGWLDEEGLQE